LGLKLDLLKDIFENFWFVEYCQFNEIDVVIGFGNEKAIHLTSILLNCWNFIHLAWLNQDLCKSQDCGPKLDLCEDMF